MKRKNNSDEKTVLTLLDVLGSCVVDIFYNHMYDRAIAIHEKTNAGLTECYRQSILNYLQESESPRFYSVLLNSLHHYVRMSTIYTDLSYPDCITLYSSMFVPKMYTTSLTTDQRVNILSLILRNSVQRFADEISSQHLGAIIDDHGDPVNVEILQDSILKILLDERDTNYDKFINAQKGGDPPKAETPKKANPAMVKLTNAFKKSIGDRSALKKRNIELTKKNKMLTKQFVDLKAMFLEQISVQKAQTQIIDELKHAIEAQPMTRPIETSIDESMSVASSHEDDELFSVQYVDSV